MTITAMTGFNNEVTASCEVTIEPADLVLTDDWSIIRNDPEYWTINDEHSITITTQPGEFYTGTDNAQNVMLTPAEGDFTVTTKLDFIPNGDYQTAGIIVYQDTDNIYGAYKRYHSGFGGNIFTDFVMNNSSFSEHTTPDANKDATVYLKVVKEGTTFSSFYSYDNETWTPIADPVEMSGLSGDLKIGLYRWQSEDRFPAGNLRGLHCKRRSSCLCRGPRERREHQLHGQLWHKRRAHAQRRRADHRQPARQVRRRFRRGNGIEPLL